MITAALQPDLAAPEEGEPRSEQWPWEALQRAMSTTGDGFFDWNLNTSVTWYSPSVSAMLGLPPGELTPRIEDLLERIHPDERDRMNSSMRRTLDAAEPIDEQIRMLHKQGEYHWFRCRAVAHRAEAGAAAHVSGCLQDIHEYRLLDERLRDQQRIAARQQRNEALDCFAAGLAHEFSNLLQVIRGYATFVYNDLPDPSEQRDDLRRALEAVERATQLTRRILDFSRNDDADASTIDLRQAVSDAEELLAALLGQSCDSRWTCNESPLPITVNPIALQQAIMNLCVNARDAMESTGQLCVRCDEVDVGEIAQQQFTNLAVGGYARLLVSDDGAGIPPEAAERIFEPFYSTKDASRGSGLGLLTVQNFARQAGGAVQVYSEPGRGSTFRLYLPLQRVLPPAAAAPAARPHGATVLLAEDNRTFRETARLILADADYRVVAVRDGKAAIESLRRAENDVQLLLFDAALLRPDAPHWFDRLRRLAERIPIVLSTGFDPLSSPARQLAELSFPIVEKPFASEALLRTVAKAIAGEAANN